MFFQSISAICETALKDPRNYPHQVPGHIQGPDAATVQVRLPMFTCASKPPATAGATSLAVARCCNLCTVLFDTVPREAQHVLHPAARTQHTRYNVAVSHRGFSRCEVAEGIAIGAILVDRMGYSDQNKRLARALTVLAPCTII